MKNIAKVKKSMTDFIVTDLSDPANSSITYENEHELTLEKLVELAVKGSYTIICETTSLIFKTTSNYGTYIIETFTKFDNCNARLVSDGLEEMIKKGETCR